MSNSSANDSLATSVVSGTGWLYASSYGGKVINLIATAVLARLLTQEDFGVAGYALVFIGFLEVLEGFGVGQALVFMREKDESRNMAFWIAVIFGFLLGIATYFAAPLAGVLFNDPRAVPVTQALALIFPITALRTVHRAILQRRMQFSLIALPEFSKAGVKAFAAIAFALFSLGAWSLIIAQLAASLVETLMYWKIHKWRPSLKIKFDRSVFKTLTSYGGGIAGLNVLGVLVNNIDNILIGRYMGAIALGTYMMGFRVPSLLIRQFVTTISQVIFPVFVHMNERKDSLADGWLKAIRYILIFTVPASLGLAAVAEPFVLAIFGQKWAGAIPVVAAISLFTLAFSTSFNIGDVYKAMGRIGLIVKINLFQAAILIPSMWYVTLKYQDIAFIAWTHVVVKVLMSILQLVIVGRVLSISLSQIARAMGTPLAAGILMCGCVLLCNEFTREWAEHWRLLAGIATGTVVYGTLAWFLLRQDIKDAIEVVRQGKRQKKRTEEIDAMPIPPQ
ncbi:MAG: lipopolysaccharide biosynthesis protein [Granulosicoccus sp.]|nr:lipopolysaccharide biosynthesis protein [Granulosicoccus sp.]